MFFFYYHIKELTLKLIRNNKIHILDIYELVEHFDNLSSHYVNEYLISHNEVDDLFDYCIHKAMSTIVRYDMRLQGARIRSSYIDDDLYESIFRDIGEYYIDTLYVKLYNYDIINDLQNNSYSRCKLVVNGLSLWIFLGCRGIKHADTYRDQRIRSN